MSELSIALSDLALSLSSLYSAGVVCHRNIHGSLGFILVGIAAGVGTLRFLHIMPLSRQNSVMSLHSWLAWLATILGVPLLAAAFCVKFQKPDVAQIHLISSIAGIMFSILFPKMKDIATTLPSTFAIFSILLHCCQANNMPGIAGTALYAVSSVFVGTTGQIFDMWCVNIFHYGLTMGNIAFLNAL